MIEVWTGKKWAVKALCIFFGIMAVCTVVSRAAASVLVAQVDVENPRRGRLSYQYEGQGKVVPEEKEWIFLWPQQQIEWSAEPGSRVKKGERLVQFRMEYLEQQIEAKENEYQQLKLQVEGQQLSSKGQKRIPSAQSAKQTLLQVEKRQKKAKKKLEKAKKQWEEYQEAQASKERENEHSDDGSYDREDDGADHAQLSGSAENSTTGQELKEAYEAAKSELSAVKEEREQAFDAYNLAKKEDKVQDANDKMMKEAARLETRASQIQVQALKKELEKLKSYQAENGKICTPKDVVVLENPLSVGDIIGGTECILIGSGEWKLQGEIMEDKAREQISPGAEIDISFSGQKMTVPVEYVEETALAAEKVGSSESENVTGKYGSSAQQKPSGYWYAAIHEQTELEGIESFSWKIQVDSKEEYEQTIPLAALREDLSGAYCMVVTEEERMLGTVQVAKRMPVMVVEKDGSSAAINSELSAQDTVITDSTKYVKEGDRIRIRE